MATHSPRVSVLMAVRNGARYIEEAMSSILNQEFSDFEFLIVDDGSTDQTPTILASIRDPRLRVIRHESLGLTRSLIHGLTLTKGEYVARQDADDISHTERLAKQVAYLDSHPDVVLVGSGVTVISDNNQILRDYLYPVQHDLLVAELMVLVSPLPHTTIMFRKTPVLDCGGYRDIFSKAQDYDLYLRLIEKYRISSVQEALCCLRYSTDSFTFEDGEGLQFQYAVLAFIASIVRRNIGIDPLDLPDRQEFLARFQAWYKTSSYPQKFFSRLRRRQARLAWANGCRTKAVRRFVASLQADPAWLPQRLGMRMTSTITAEASGWIQHEMSITP